MKPSISLRLLVLASAAFLLVSANARAQSFFVSTSSPALDLATPPSSITTFATLPGNATSEGLAFDASGNLYVADGVNREIYKVTSAGTVILFATLPGHPSGLAFDDAGNLYATESGPNEISQITSGGAVSLFASLPVNSSPQGLAFFGGNLYVADNGDTTQLLQVDSSGAVTTLAPLPADSSPLGVAADADGNLYVAEAALDQIAEVTPAGAVTTFATLPSGSFPFGLNFDSAGNLYTADSGSGDISRVTPTGGVTEFISGLGAPEYLAPAPTMTIVPGGVGNFSTRLNVQTGDNVLIAGFILQGSASKTVLLRAIGPSLSNENVSGALADPMLHLYNSDGTLLGSNNDWQTTVLGGLITSDQKAEIQGSGLAPTDAQESAIEVTLPPGAYTAVVQGVDNTTGIGLAEVYDLQPTNPTLLANVSTRGFVQTGDDVLIGGFILTGQSANVVVRALGPSLTASNVPDVLADPTLELYDGNGNSIATNDNWQSDQAAAIMATGLQPTDPNESALVESLSPGVYTAIVRGKDATTGNALIEVYDLN